jgi:hypothetical protein
LRAAETVGLKPRTAEKGLAVLNLAEAGDPKAKTAIESIGREEMSTVHAARSLFENHKIRRANRIQRGRDAITE